MVYTGIVICIYAHGDDVDASQNRSEDWVEVQARERTFLTTWATLTGKKLVTKAIMHAPHASISTDLHSHPPHRPNGGKPQRVRRSSPVHD